MKAWSPGAGEADNSSTIGSRSLAEEATTTIGNVSIQLSQKAWIMRLSGHRARAPDLLMIMLPPNPSVRLRTQRRLSLCTPPHRHTASSGITLVPDHCTAAASQYPTTLRGSPVLSVETGRTTEHDHEFSSESRLRRRGARYIF